MGTDDELDMIHTEIDRLLDRYPSESWTLPQARRVLRTLSGFRPHALTHSCPVNRRRPVA